MRPRGRVTPLQDPRPPAGVGDRCGADPPRAPRAHIWCRGGQPLALWAFGLGAEIDTGVRILAGLAPLFGTPEYMAPEQVRNRRNDGRTDIYSLGVILYQSEEH